MPYYADSRGENHRSARDERVLNGCGQVDECDEQEEVSHSVKKSVSKSEFDGAETLK